MMTNYIASSMLLTGLLSVAAVISARNQIGSPPPNGWNVGLESKAMAMNIGQDAKASSHTEKLLVTTKRKNVDGVRIAGSSFPDCTHACGSCFPCKLVMIGFACAALEESETCPVAYKCLCHDKAFPVP